MIQDVDVSCSVVLPAFCHLHRVMETSDDDPAYVARFKTAFQEDLTSHQENFMNNEWLKIATALDPFFKDLKYLPKSDRGGVWTTLGGLLHEQSPPQQTCEDEPPKKMSLLQMDVLQMRSCCLTESCTCTEQNLSLGLSL